MNTFAWALSLGMFLLGTFTWDFSLEYGCLGSLALSLSLGNFGSRISCLGKWASEAGEPLTGRTLRRLSLLAASSRRRVRTLLATAS